MTDNTIRGITLDPDANVENLGDEADMIIEREWEYNGLSCMVVQQIEYYDWTIHEDEGLEEGPHTLIGLVHAPEVESPLGAYSRVRPAREPMSGGWHYWPEFIGRQPVTDDMIATAKSRTTTLARGLFGHSQENICTCDWKTTNMKRHDAGCPGKKWAQEKRA